MKYPFEQTPYHPKEFLNPQDKEEFYNLKNLMKNLDDKGVEEWFKIQNPRMKKKGKENLAKVIGESTYYFSTSGMLNLKQINDIETKQYQILLKHFKIEEQLRILVQIDDFIGEKVFNILYQTAKLQKKEDIFYKSRLLLNYLGKEFYKENFTDIKNIELIIEKKIVDLEHNYIAFYNENGNSISYYSNLNNNYNLTDQIILNYTQEKKEFILSYNKELPLKEKAYQLLEDIQKDYSKRDWFSIDNEKTLKQLTQNINNYIKAVLYFDLNKKLPDKSIKNSLKKI